MATQPRPMCICAYHCTNGPYHENACCNLGPCKCWCHGPHEIAQEQREAQDGREKGAQ